jgi:predicted NBD/HSP70 family sugar kinase
MEKKCAKKNAAIVVGGNAIGGGAFINGHLLQGVHLNVGEFGYMLIDNDIKDLSFHSLGGKGGLNGLVKYVRQNGYDVKNGLEVFAEMTKDKTLKEVVGQQLLYTTIGIINIQYIIDPSIILVGGCY